MEAIRTYLENMFINLPATPEALRAKRELLQMMEDKYNELRAAGKTDNEAVGIVISEFGNLEELAEALGIDTIVRAEKEARAEEAQTSDAPEVSVNVARQYLEEYISCARRIGLGVAMIIASPVPLLLTPDNELAEVVGGFTMCAMIAVAVILFVFSGIRMSEWKEIRYGNVRLSFEALQYLGDRRASFKPMFAMYLTIGIVLIVLSPAPAVTMTTLADMAQGALDAQYIDWIGSAAMLLFVAVGVYFIVMSSIRLAGHGALLKRAGVKVDTHAPIGETVKEGKPAKQMKGKEKEFKAIWNQTVLCLYLIWSFTTFRWHMTWIIFPLSALIYRVISKALFSEG